MDKRKILTKVVAGAMVVLMVLGATSTFLYYLLAK